MDRTPPPPRGEWLNRYRQSIRKLRLPDPRLEKRRLIKKIHYLLNNFLGVGGASQRFVVSTVEGPQFYIFGDSAPKGRYETSFIDSVAEFYIEDPNDGGLYKVMLTQRASYFSAPSDVKIFFGDDFEYDVTSHFMDVPIERYLRVVEFPDDPEICIFFHTVHARGEERVDLPLYRANASGRALDFGRVPGRAPMTYDMEPLETTKRELKFGPPSENELMLHDIESHDGDVFYDVMDVVGNTGYSFV